MAPAKPDSPRTAARPALLVASFSPGHVDLDYLQELRARGFEVDATQSLTELTKERLARYNVVVVFATPTAVAIAGRAPVPTGGDTAFRALIDGYVASGGGVLLMPEESNRVMQRVSSLSEPWGAHVLAEHVVETSSARKALLPHGARMVSLAFTDNIAESPITRGVRGIWYPYTNVGLGDLTLPLEVDEHWRVLVRASPSSHSEPVPLEGDPAPGLKQHAEARVAPALFAVRELGAGRVALVAQWPQFSFGAGTKWIYDRVVLERGVGDKPSDFGRLLEQTLRWLAEPSLRKGAPGGFLVNQAGPLDSDATSGAKAQFAAVPPTYDAAALTNAQLGANERVYRGLIGARSAASGGRGSVRDYALAARRAGLDYVVFLEDFAALTPERLRGLVEDCQRESSADLLLVPGYSARNNLGNLMFFFGPQLSWPPDAVLTGESKRTIYLQQADGRGGFVSGPTGYLDWMLDGYQIQAGYFDFASAPNGVRFWDVRLATMTALRTIRRGRVVEDLLEPYLLSVASTDPPIPVVVDEVNSPAELTREAKSQRGLTHVVARSLSLDDPAGVYGRGLRWRGMFDAMTTFVSTGPRILAWPATFRAHTYGGEGFVPERAVMFAPIVVESDVGLRELLIYDGPRLFRRLQLRGQKSYRGTLVLDGGIQRDLVLVVRDVRGGSAQSFARRSWSDGTLAPIFCGDRINDCRSQPLLARGPYSLPISSAPTLPTDEAGRTWDGGPPGNIPALGAQSTLPTLWAREGEWSAARMDGIPTLSFSDEGATGVRAERREMFADNLRAIAGPWTTFGPLSSQPPLFEHMQRYRQWLGHSTGAPLNEWAGFSIRTGGTASLFTSELKFRRPANGQLLLWGNIRRQLNVNYVKIRRDGALEPVSLDVPGTALTLENEEGLGAFADDGSMNAQVLINRTGPLRIASTANALELTAATLPARFETDTTFSLELAAFAFSLRSEIRSANEIAPILDYLRDVDAIRATRGARVASAGLADFEVADGAVEVEARHAPFDGVIPARVGSMNPRWSAGMLLREGPISGFYGPGHERYRALAVDADGRAHFPIDASTGPFRALLGHPVVADERGKALFIQVTCLGGSPLRWHVSVNNPTSRRIRSELRQTMELPGLSFASRTLELEAGAMVTLQ